ncbi:MAG: HAD family hydrolase [Candidatus Nanoarchaeia archaeon]
MKKAVIFDFWGTIVEIGVHPSPIRQIKSILNLDIPFSSYIIKFEEVFMKQPYKNLFEAFTEVCKAFRIEPKQELLEELVGLWNKNKLLAKPFPETIEVLEELKSEGYKLVMLSNTDCFSIEEIMEKYDLIKYFDSIVLSYQVRMLKNNPRMFQKILKDINASKEEVVMVGDSIESDIIGAKKAGIDAILVDRTGTRDFVPKIKDLTELKNYLEGE